MTSESNSGSVSAYTEQPAPVPKSISEDVTFPEQVWPVVILSVILFVLLVWKAIDEVVDNPNDDDNGKDRRPPY
jgi:hypothetical protein